MAGPVTWVGMHPRRLATTWSRSANRPCARVQRAVCRVYAAVAASIRDPSWVHGCITTASPRILLMVCAFPQFVG